MNSIKYLTAFSVLGLAVGTALPANAIEFIDFQNPNDLTTPPFQSVPNGFQSADSNLISFSDSIGSNLQIGLFIELPQPPFPDPPDNVGLGVGIEDSSQLEISFADTFESLSFDIGNDNPSVVPAGSIGLLTVFSNGTQAGQVELTLNRDPMGMVDQRIEFLPQDFLPGFNSFNSATFSLADPNSQLPLSASEIIDNLEAAPATPPNVIPFEAEGTMGLAALGGYFWYRNRRKRNQASS